MKLKRLFSWLTALVMLVSLLPAGALTVSAAGSETRTVLVGLIEYVYNDLGDDFRVHYWGGADGPDDAAVTGNNSTVQMSLGSSYWNGDPQLFWICTAKIPADATGFKVWHPGSGRWFGGTDGDAQNEDRAFIFEYGGSDLAIYGTPVTTLGTPQDWDTLAADVELGQDYRGRTVTMMSGLAATVPIGRDERPFRGCFEGSGNLLTVSFDDRGTQGVAPFRCIADGAVIQNLNVEGSVIGGRHSAGLVGFCQGGDQNDPNRIDGCQVAVNVGGSDYNGGIVGHGLDSCLYIENCVFNGSLSDSDQSCGGLQGWADGNDLTVNNCLSCGSYTSTGSYDPIAIGCGNSSMYNAFFTGYPLVTSSYGTPVSLELPDDSLAMEANVLGRQVWILGQTEVDGISDWYLYNGSEHPITPVVRYNGNTLTENVDYVWTIDGQVVTGVTEKGCHELTVTGIGAYNGSVTLPVIVVPAALTGTGIQGDPWIINDGADWVRFALDVEDGNDFSNEYVQLENDIPVYRKVGVVNGSSQDIPFSGIFEGGGHTICVNITDTGNQGTAPFCYINGATIRNLNATGSVRGDYHAAGLVGFTKDQNNLIENCVVDTDVYANDYIGGIVGHALDSDLIIDNCLYSGLLAGGGNAKGALLGWDDPGGAKNINHSVYAARGNQDSNALDLVMGRSGSVTIAQCYRTTDFCQLGTRVYDFPEPDSVYGWVTAAGHAFVLPCEISGVPSVLNCAGGPVTLSPLVEFDGTPLTEDTDYTLEIVQLEGAKNASVSNAGRYELHVNGIGSYDGTQVFGFRVGSITWAVDPDPNGNMTILHISGVGPMEDQALYPYDGSGRYGVAEANMGSITAVVIDVGVTDIGDYAFDGFPNLEKALIPAGMERIGEYAFTVSSPAFTQLRLPPSLKYIELGAFHGLSDVTEVWTGRDAQDWQDFIYSSDVDLTDNQVLTGWNNNWQPIYYHDSSVNPIQTAPTPQGTVRFLVEGADANQAGDGQLVNVIPEPIDGYELDGLQVSFDENGVTYTFSIQPVTAFTMAFGSNVTVTPSFRAIVFSITYQGLAGVSPLPANPSSYTVQTPSFTLINPAKTGYDFLGWILNGGTSVVLNYTVHQGTVGNLDFTASWQAHSYSVHFDPNGGAGTMADQLFSYDAAQSLDLNAYYRTGYVFTGWNTMPNGSGTSYADGDTVLNLTAANNGAVTLYAQWAPISYTVQFDPNGGTGSMADQSLVYDLSRNLRPNAFTRVCYHFVGWNTMPDGSGTSFADRDPVLNLTSVNNDVVILYAQWVPYHYTVRFEPNGGTGTMPDQNFDYDQAQPLDPNVFSWIGYRFIEWNTQPDGSGTSYQDGEIVSNLSAVDNDTVTLFAQWVPIRYTIQFDPNGGMGTMPDQLFIYDQAQNLDPNTFTLSGHNFTDWNTMPDGSGTSYADMDLILNLTAVDGDVITLYAQWTGWSYFIHFDPNHSPVNGSMGDEPCFHGQPQPLPGNDFFVPGYQFLGWSFDPTGASGIDYNDGDLIDLLPAFDGEIITLYALWAPFNYLIHFDPNGGTGSMGDMGLVYDSPGNLNLNAFTRPGYDFDHWNTQPDDSGTTYYDGDLVNIVPGSDGEVIVLYAQWTPYTYSIHFDANNVNATGTMADQPFTYDNPQSLTPNAFTVPGYSFDCWNELPNGSGTAYQDSATVNLLPPSNGAIIPLYAQWKANNYYVVFDPNPPAGTVSGAMPSQYCSYGTPTPLTMNAFSIPGYTFLGWDTVPTGTTWVYNDGDPINVPVAADGQTVTLYARWRPNNYTVYFDANGGGGGLMQNQSFTYDVPQRLTGNAFTRANYNFVGWCLDINGNGVIYPDRDTVVNLTDQDGVTITLYAIWEPYHCTVVFHPNGAPGADYSQVFYWDQAQNLLLNSFFRSGYGFDHWNDLPNDTGPMTCRDGANLSNFWTTNAQVIDLYAQWRAAQYTIVFDPNGASGPLMPDQVFTYGISGQLYMNQYSRPGYRFDGWKDWNGNAYSDGDTILNLTDQDGAFIVLEAQWVPYQYTICFLGNAPGILNTVDGVMLDLNMTYDQGRNLPGNAYTCRGYRFSHWNTRADGSGTSYTNQQFVNILPSYDGELIRLYAQWIPNTYTVVFDPNGGTGTMANQQFTYDQYGTLQANTFTRLGYSFNGWNTRADGSGTSYADGATVANLTATHNGSVTLYAQWRAHTYVVQFDRNGANLGRMQSQSFTYDVAQPLSLNVFIKQDSHFRCWNTMPDGSGTSYQDGESVMNLTAVDNGVVTLYAQWAPGLWEIGTEIIGGSMVFSPSPPCEAGTVVTLTAYPDPGNLLYTISAVYYDVEGMPVAFSLEKLGEEEYMWSFEMPAGDVMITAVFGPPVSDGFYLIGPDWTLAGIDTAKLFTPDPAAEGQYLLETNLTMGQQIKVARVENNAVAALYPDDLANVYAVDGFHAGTVCVHFCEYFQDDWVDFGGYFFLDTPSQIASPFEDVSTEAWYLYPVIWAVQNGITAGSSATTFSPAASCTRAEIVTFLWRSAGSPEPNTAESPFTDVSRPGAYYYKAVLWAWENGITVGVSADRFGVSQKCTRAQVVTFLWRMAGSPPSTLTELSFTDLQPNAWYEEAVRWAVENGISVGTSELSFSPNRVCSRAEVVTFLYHFYTDD